ncbi:MAG: hypothetical protein QOH88_25 [Verrucomicrobiota bacterium]|jgi:hypothetical protein
MNPQLSNLKPFITKKARQLAAARLRMTDEKVALLIVKAINPFEILTNQEEAILRGVTRNTITSMKAAREIPPKA